MAALARKRIRQTRDWTQGLTAEDYAANPLLQAAVERNFIAIGEAIRDLARSVDLFALDPTGPWREPIRFRDFLAHTYSDAVNSMMCGRPFKMICQNLRQPSCGSSHSYHNETSHEASCTKS